jgi:hypothetical protein
VLSKCSSKNYSGYFERVILKFQKAIKSNRNNLPSTKQKHKNLLESFIKQLENFVRGLQLVEFELFHMLKHF